MRSEQRWFMGTNAFFIRAACEIPSENLAKPDAFGCTLPAHIPDADSPLTAVRRRGKNRSHDSEVSKVARRFYSRAGSLLCGSFRPASPPNLLKSTSAREDGCCWG